MLHEYIHIYMLHKSKLPYGNQIRIFDTMTICNKIIDGQRSYYYIIVKYNSILELPYYSLMITII